MFKQKRVYCLCILVVSLSLKTTHENNKNIEITKAVIPSAGWGTRWLPVSKGIPKEMVPVLNKPSIQYGVEECLESGIPNIFIITGKAKTAIENYFDPNTELDLFLEKRNKSNLVTNVKKIIKKAHFTYVRQPEALGLGHAVLMAKSSIGKEFFAVILPDDIMDCKKNHPGIGQLINIAKKEHANVIAVEEVPMDQVSSKGVIAIKKQLSSDTFEVASLVEKPKREDAPSNLAIIGRYVLSDKIFFSLETIMKKNVGEIQLTDAINHMVQNGEKVIAYKIHGARYDTGNLLGWLKVNIKKALAHPQYSEYVKNIFMHTQK